MRGRHLQTALKYITVPEKTGGGRYVNGVGCQPAYAYEQMRETKNLFAKPDKRQAYHIIISFEEGEITPDTAFEFMERFVDEYLKGEYECVYAVHDNTAHIHGHIIFNSVNKITGKKYRYEKGDWAKNIQPITNRLCSEYGLSTIKVDEDAAKPEESYKEWNDGRGEKNIWSDMIRRDIDAAIILSQNKEDFLRIIVEKGYDVKQNKYLSIRPPGMTRYRRCKSLGTRYSEDAILDRINSENLNTYRYDHKPTQILRVHIPYHLKRAKLSGLQRKHFWKLYKIGKLKKRPYSQAWKFRDDIRRFKKLQAQYLFLANHEIHDREKLIQIRDELDEKRLTCNSEKSALYKEKARFQPLFDIVKRLSEIEAAERSFRDGDEFFIEEHLEYEALMKKLSASSYSIEDITQFQTYYSEKSDALKDRSVTISRELRIARELLKEYDPPTPITKTKEPKQDKERRHRQPR